MNHALAVRDWLPGSWTGNLMGPETDPDLPILYSGTNTSPIEIAIIAAMTKERYRIESRVAEAPEELEYRSRAERLKCPGSGGVFILALDGPMQALGTHEIPDHAESSVQEARQKLLFERLDTLQNKAHGYEESDDIKVPTDQACKEAKDFIRLLPLSTILAPKIYFAEDGEIIFVWKRKEDNLHVDLGLYGDGTYSYLATNNNEEGLTEDEVDVNKGLSDKLLPMLII